VDIETIIDLDLRDIEIRDNIEKKVGVRVHAEIKDIKEIINNTSNPGQNHSDIGTGNSHKMEERGATGRITISSTLKMSSDIMIPTNSIKSFMIREEAQRIIKVPNLQIKMMVVIADLDLDVIILRKNTKVRKASPLKRVMILENLVVLLLMVIAQMVVLIENSTPGTSYSRLGIHLEITKSLVT
jgi:hypothetical protein